MIKRASILGLLVLMLGCGIYHRPQPTTYIPKIILNPSSMMILHSHDSVVRYIAYEGIVVSPIRKEDEVIQVILNRTSVIIPNKGVECKGIQKETVSIAHVIWENTEKKIAFIVEEPFCMIGLYESLLQEHGYLKEKTDGRSNKEPTQEEQGTEEQDPGHQGSDEASSGRSDGSRALCPCEERRQCTPWDARR